MILALDPSTTCLGWAVETPLGLGSIAIAKGTRAARFVGLRSCVANLIELYSPTVVVYYRPFARGDDATRCQWGAAAIIEVEAEAAGAAVLDMAEGTVRSFHGLTPPKELKKGDRRGWLKAAALSLTQSKGVHPDTDDAADAFLLLDYVKGHIRYEANTRANRPRAGANQATDPSIPGAEGGTRGRTRSSVRRRGGGTAAGRGIPAAQGTEDCS